MEKRIMNKEAIEKRLGDIWFSNGTYKAPMRDSHVMLAIESGVIKCGFNYLKGEKVESASKRICIKLWCNRPSSSRHFVFLYEYGNGSYRMILQEEVDTWNLRFHWNVKGGSRIMELDCHNGRLFISYPRNATVYEDDWRKCEECGMEKRLHVDPIDSMLRGKYTSWKAMCGYGHLFEYYED